MGKKKNKKTNPRNIPMSKSMINQHDIILEATQDNVYNGWLLVFTAMLEQEDMGADVMSKVWAAVNALTTDTNLGDPEAKKFITKPKFTKPQADYAIRQAEAIMGFGLPYPNLSFQNIRSEVELEKVKRKIRKNAIYSAFCVICEGFMSMKMFSNDKLHRLFLCADLLEAEIEGGCNNYDEMQANLTKIGVLVYKDNGSVRLIVSDEVKRQSEIAFSKLEGGAKSLDVTPIEVEIREPDDVCDEEQSA